MLEGGYFSWKVKIYRKLAPYGLRLESIEREAPFEVGQSFSAKATIYMGFGILKTWLTYCYAGKKPVWSERWVLG